MGISSDEFEALIEECYYHVRDCDDGSVATYIPQLAHVNPDLFGVSFCDVNGRMFSIGDITEPFCLQSCASPLTYLIARELEKDDSNFEEPQAVSALPFDADCDNRVQELLRPTSTNTNTQHNQNAGGGWGKEDEDHRDPIRVHDHVGYEPSGRAYNEFVLNTNGLPHNPLINAGAIMVASLIKPKHEPSQRFEHILKIITKMGGNLPGISFDNSTYLSEKRHADRNISLAHYMRENRAFVGYPTTSEISEHMDLYFQACSVSVNTKVGAVMAATIANSGICPITEERIIASSVVKDCLSIMYTCGMYEASGLFSFHVGLPAKSGVSGCLLLCVPRVGGFCIWSPRLDGTGNSTRAIQFALEFTRRTRGRYHMFRSALLAASGAGTAAASRGEPSGAKLAVAGAGDGSAANEIATDINAKIKGQGADGRISETGGEEGEEEDSINPLAFVGEEVLINRLMHATEANPKAAVESLNNISEDEQEDFQQDLDELRANTTVHTAHGSLFFFEHLLEEVVSSLKLDSETTQEAYLRVLSLPNSDKKTCLHIAAAEGKLDFVAYILRQGVTPDMKDHWGNTPAFEARKMLQQLQEAYMMTYGQEQEDGGFSYIEEYLANRNREASANADSEGARDVSHSSGGGGGGSMLGGAGGDGEDNEEEELGPEDKMLEAIFDYDQILDMLVSGLQPAQDDVHNMHNGSNPSRDNKPAPAEGATSTTSSSSTTKASSSSGGFGRESISAARSWVRDQPVQGRDSDGSQRGSHSTHEKSYSTQREYSTHREHRDRDKDGSSPSLFSVQHLQHVRSSESPFANLSSRGGAHNSHSHNEREQRNPFASHALKDHKNQRDDRNQREDKHAKKESGGGSGGSGAGMPKRQTSSGSLSDPDGRTHTLNTSIGSHNSLSSLGGGGSSAVAYNSANPAVRDRNRDRDRDSHREREMTGFRLKDRDSSTSGSSTNTFTTAGAGVGNAGVLSLDMERREPDNGYGVAVSRNNRSSSYTAATSGSGSNSPVKNIHISRMGTPSSSRQYGSTSGMHTSSSSTATTTASSTNNSAAAGASPSVRFSLPVVKTPLPIPPKNVANLVSPSYPSPTNAQYAASIAMTGNTSSSASSSSGSHSPRKEEKI